MGITRMNGDVTLLVASCDNYEDVWLPCSKSLMLYWADCNYEKVLVTETKDAPVSFCFDRTIKIKDKSFTRRLRTALDQIQTEYVFFMIDDHFPTEQVNQSTVDAARNYMESDRNVGVIYMETAEKRENGFKNPIKTASYYEIPFGSAYRIPCAPSLWRINFLKMVMDYDYSAWDFEKKVCFEIKTKDYKVLTVNKDNWKRLTYAGAIHNGKWMREMIEYTKKINIELDCSSRKYKSWIDIAKDSIKKFIFNINTPLIVKIQNYFSTK